MRKLFISYAILLLPGYISSSCEGTCTINCQCNQSGFTESSSSTFGNKISKSDCETVAGSYENSYCDCEYDWEPF